MCLESSVKFSMAEFPGKRRKKEGKCNIGKMELRAGEGFMENTRTLVMIEGTVLATGDPFHSDDLI